MSKEACEQALPSTRSTRASGSFWRVLLFSDFFDFLSRLPYTESLLAGCITVWKGRNQFTSPIKINEKEMKSVLSDRKKVVKI